MTDVIDGGGFLGDAQRVAQRQNLNRDADLHAFGPHGNGAGDVERRREDRPFGGVVQFRQPHDVEAGSLGFVHLLEGLGKGFGFALARPALKFVEHAEFHGASSPCLATASAGFGHPARVVASFPRSVANACPTSPDLHPMWAG